MTREPLDLADPQLRDRAVAAARGQQPFDVLLKGGTVVDVATGTLRLADVGLVGALIASVHEAGTRSDASTVHDCAGRFLAPGFIDTHMHIESSMVTPRRYAEVVVPQGTTTVCWDPHEVGNVLGLEGVRWAIAASRDLPLRVLVMAPSCVPSAPGLEVAGAVFEAPEMRTMLADPAVIGVAEVMDMRGVLTRSPHMRGIVGAGLESGKLVCGHGRDLKGADVQGFAAAGIESDHEITSGEDLLTKLRAGFTVELRGSHDYVLPGVVEALKTLPHVPQTLTVCTDDIFPDDLVAVGGMNDVLRRLVGYGMAAIDAIRAATLNAAMRLGRRDLGLVAPGRRADIVVLSDLVGFRATSVFVSGTHVADRDRLIVPLRPDREPAPTSTMKLASLTTRDFQIAAADPQSADVRLRTIVRPRFTAWGEVPATLRDGFAALPDGLSLMAVVHRHGRAPAVPRLAPLEDWGVFRGAIATTVAHDSHNLNVFGREPLDMATAANALIACGGGMAVARDGAVLATLPLPVCGLLSEAPAIEVGRDFAALKAAADQVAEWKPPLRVFKAVTGASLACNPGPHLTDRGLADGTTGVVYETAVVTP